MPQQLPKSARRILSALSILFALHLSVVASHAASINQNAYFQGDAGPYHLLVAIHTPESLPGQARVDLQLASGDADSVQVEPVRILDPERTESASSSQLIADSGDPRKFSGRVRLAASGSWALRVNIKGNAGEATTVIPFNAIAQRGGWPRPALLRACAGLLLLLLAVLATVKRRARSPRQPHGPRSWTAVPAISVGFLLGILLLTWGWIEAGHSLVHEPIFTAPALQAALARGNELSLQIAPSPASPQITSAPLPAYVAIIRLPQLDRFYTFVSQSTPGGTVSVTLPGADAGHYKVFVTVVTAIGVTQVASAELDLPNLPAAPLGTDGSQTSAPAFTHPSGRPITEFQWPDSLSMEWIRSPAPIRPAELSLLSFQVKDARGVPASDLEPLSGMQGQAFIFRADGGDYTHLNPFGSAPNAELIAAEKALRLPSGNAAVGEMGLSSEISFPYAFPQPGDYRLFVQIRQKGEIKTAVFDTRITP